MTPAEDDTPRALFAGAANRWTRLLPWAVAFVLSVALLPTTIVVLSNDYGLNVGVASALALTQSAPLLLAVVRPLRAWFVVLTADVAGALLLLTTDFSDQLLWPFPPMEIVGYVGLCLALGLRALPRRTLFLVWLVTAAANVGLVFLAPHGMNALSMLVTILSGVTLLLSAALRERHEVQRRLVAQETISEAERARRTVLEERARIARELHDVVAHHMSVITVQANTAPYRLDGVTPAVREELTSIAATARESLGEMRRLLSVLRNDDADGELEPQPGPARIGQLVGAMARAGVPVRYAPCDAEVPEAVGLSAYRIVQEALANVVRHAPGAPTEVSVSAHGEWLTVLVVNAPPAEPAAGPVENAGTGHGLVGMRERVRLVGGELETGPPPGGGFRVMARLPLTQTRNGTERTA